MYVWSFGSSLPKEETSFVTLIRPFDNYTWIMSIVSSTIMCVILIAIQKLWAYLSGEPFRSDFVYQGISFMRQYLV